MMNAFIDRNGTSLMETDYYSLEEELCFISAITGVNLVNFGRPSGAESGC